MMALTATATQSLRKSVEQILGMNNPFIGQLSPDKTNLFFCVKEIDCFNAAFMPIVERL